MKSLIDKPRSWHVRTGNLVADIRENLFHVLLLTLVALATALDPLTKFLRQSMVRLKTSRGNPAANLLILLTYHQLVHGEEIRGKL